MRRRTIIIAIPLLSAAAIVFRSLFKNRSASDAESFRERVLSLVRVSYPKVSFEAPAQSTDVIIANEIQIGLQNLRAMFEQSDRTQQTFEQLVAEHFKVALQDTPSVPDFAAARQKLRPQIMPPEYAQHAPLISFSFGETLAIGIVLDMDNGYLYLKQDDAIQWNKTHRELLDVAVANLDEASRELPMQSSDNDEVKWIGIETKDGFDAARILIPGLRGFLAERLGSPFRFAIPNRDFLICWNTSASSRFTEFTETKIRNDFETQPYPLSPHFFEATDDGTITELNQ